MEKSKVLTGVTIANSVGAIADSIAIPLADYDGALIFVPADSPITSIEWYASYDNVTYFKLYSSDNEEVVQTVAEENSYHLSPSCNVAPFVKGVANATGNVVVALKRMS